MSLDEEDDDGGEVRLATAPAGGERVDAWLAREWPDLSRARIQGLIGAGKLTADGAPITHASDKARTGATYALVLPPPEPAAPQPEAIPLNVVFEDAHLIVVDKPAGMAVHPAPGSMRSTLVNALLAHCATSLSGIGGVARPGIVHRIDKETTGLIVAAKNDAAHAGLAKLFAKHDLERVYYAVARGAPNPRTGIVDAPLGRSSEDRRKMVVRENGRRAVTHYWTIERFGQIEGASIGSPAASLLECRLETGRTHQIRAHMAHIGSPLVGDPLYGVQRPMKISQAAREAIQAFPRQALHAAVLGFAHPVTGDQLRFTSDLPADMTALLGVLRQM